MLTTTQGRFWLLFLPYNTELLYQSKITTFILLLRLRNKVQTGFRSRLMTWHHLKGTVIGGQKVRYVKYFGNTLQ